MTASDGGRKSFPHAQKFCASQGWSKRSRIKRWNRASPLFAMSYTSVLTHGVIHISLRLLDRQWTGILNNAFWRPNKFLRRSVQLRTSRCSHQVRVSNFRTVNGFHHRELMFERTPTSSGFPQCSTFKFSIRREWWIYFQASENLNQRQPVSTIYSKRSIVIDLPWQAIESVSEAGTFALCIVVTAFGESHNAAVISGPLAW